jgi:hypothetical protein
MNIRKTVSYGLEFSPTLIQMLIKDRRSRLLRPQIRGRYQVVRSRAGVN